MVLFTIYILINGFYSYEYKSLTNWNSGSPVSGEKHLASCCCSINRIIILNPITPSPPPANIKWQRATASNVYEYFWLKA